MTAVRPACPVPGGREPAVIGWREWVALPALGIPRIKAKIDTGARTSALHAFRVATERRDGREWVHFSIHPLQRDTREVVECRAPVADRRQVTDSGGHRELRIVIETAVRLAGTEWTIETTLTDRDTMGFRMLLGRTALRGRFLVDPRGSYRAGKSARPVPATETTGRP